MSTGTQEHTDLCWAQHVIEDDLPFCGCGYYRGRIELVRDVLRDCPLYENGARAKYDSPLAEWLLCMLDNAELIDHGTSIGRSWITDKGQRLLAILNDPANLEALADRDWMPCAACDEEQRDA